jgi:hypothetical protein
METMLFSGKWIELDIILLSEINQFHKDKYHMFSLICGSYGETKQTKQKQCHESKRETAREVEGAGKGGGTRDKKET